MTTDLDELLGSIPEDTWRRKVRYWMRLRRLRELRREIKWGIQRWRRGYSDCDMWGFDTYLARVISRGVRQLITELHGWPGEPMTFEEWKDILDKIATGYEAHLALEDEMPRRDSDRETELHRQYKEGAALFVEWFGGLWD